MKKFLSSIMNASADISLVEVMITMLVAGLATTLILRSGPTAAAYPMAMSAVCMSKTEFSKYVRTYRETPSQIAKPDNYINSEIRTYENYRREFVTVAVNLTTQETCILISGTYKRK